MSRHHPMNPLHRPENHDISMPRRFGLGSILLMNLYIRLGCGIFGPNPLPGRRLVDAAQKIDPGYCLDAPGVMPAGGMVADEFEGAPVPMMLMTERQA